MVKSDNERICKQVDFYFSDSNLPYDKFLWTLRANSVDGWIPIETIASFKKIKMITDDMDMVVKALAENQSDIYELDKDHKNIRRTSKIIQQDHNARSIFIKGLPLVDVDAKDPVAELFILQDKVDELFSEKGQVLCVRLKKTHDYHKKFKGTAYIEFESPEKAKEVAALKEIGFEGKTIEIMYKPDYHDMKAEQYKDSPRTGKKPFRFNAFKLQTTNTFNKRRRSSNGFAIKEAKKSKNE